MYPPTKHIRTYLRSYIATYVYIQYDQICKKGLIHASNSSTLRMCNSASIGPTALKFSSRTFLSLY